MDKNKMILIVAISALVIGCLAVPVIMDSDSDAEVTGKFIPKHPLVKPHTTGETGLKTIDYYEVNPLNIKIAESSLDTKLVDSSFHWYHWKDSDNLVDKVNSLKEEVAPDTGAVTITGIAAEEERDVSGADKSPKFTMTLKSVLSGTEQQKAVPGYFELSFTNSESSDNHLTTDSKYTFNIAYEIVSKVKSGDGNVTNTLTQVLFYKIIVETTNKVTIHDSNGGSSSEFKLGKSVDPTKLVVSNDSIIGTWYAQGLPAGLAMDYEGNIIGVPAELGTKVAKIFVTDFSGKIHQGEYSIVVTGESALKITGKSTNIVYTGKAPTNLKSMDRYMMYSGDIGNFTLGVTPAGTLHVKMVNSIGEVEPIDATKSSESVYTFNVNPQGTGNYTIVISDNENTAMFMITVLSKVQDVQADIFFDLTS